jgi:hypothetical protein
MSSGVTTEPAEPRPGFGAAGRKTVDAALRVGGPACAQFLKSGVILPNIQTPTAVAEDGAAQARKELDKAVSAEMTVVPTAHPPGFGAGRPATPPEGGGVTERR